MLDVIFRCNRLYKIQGAKKSWLMVAAVTRDILCQMKRGVSAVKESNVGNIFEFHDTVA